MSGLPVLYSFRRCPYAMRARLAIVFAGIRVELREVVLKQKPAAMLTISPKGTVPVLQLADGQVLEQSADIVRWALRESDPQGLLQVNGSAAQDLIERNDGEFKYWLDRYKYPERYPELTQQDYRQRGEQFLQQLEELLAQNVYLLGAQPSIADICVMPFVRQFAHVDRAAFSKLPYPHLQRWLDGWLVRTEFLQVMAKYAQWQEGAEQLIFP